MHAHSRVKFSLRSLNEVFAEDLQFPRGRDLAKIASLTLSGLSSNEPPPYYRTRSCCLDTPRKPVIGREGWARRERGSGTRGQGAENLRGTPPLNAMKSHSSLIPGKPRGPVAFRNRDVTESPTSVRFSLGLGF